MKHVIRLPDDDPIKRDGGNSVHTIKNQKHLLLNPVMQRR